MGVDFPTSLIESVDRLILTMHPKHKNRGKSGTNGEGENGGSGRTVDEKSRIFKGLALPDKEEPEDDNTEDIVGSGLAELAALGLKAKRIEKQEPDAVDDTLAMLENLEGKSKQRSSGPEKSTRKRSRSPEYGDYGSSCRYRLRSRSRSRERKGRNGRGRDDVDGYGRTRRGRYEEDEDDQFRRPPLMVLDDEPKLHKIYNGKVMGVKDFGAFVNLEGVKGKVDGLVHVSNMKEGARVNHPSDLLAREQPVKVKVISIEGKRIGLSMKEVEQNTGRDLIPEKRLGTGANMEKMNGRGSSRYGNLDSKVPVLPVLEDDLGYVPRTKKRMTSPERWEIKQLIASGAISAVDYPEIDEEYHATLTGEGEFEEEEDVDIEVRGEEPPFLAGQTRQSLELSPIRVVKAPDGSLNRAAMAGTTLAKDRRELRQQQAQDQAAQEAAKVDLNAQWHDPMVNPEKRVFASDLKSSTLNRGGGDMPEWKRVTMSKDQSFGKRTSLSIKEQRESLPVFKLRNILYTKEPESDYLDAALITVMQIHLSEPSGDILLFLTGQEEIDTSCEILYERMKALGSSVPELIILPVYSALPSEMQSKIFDPAPSGSRKVVIATNIAETSITIDNIYYVVDPGFVKQNAFDPKLGMDSLVVTPISQAQAKQRAGRAGRTGPGKCYRLYTEAAFQSEMLPTSVPEIQRQNLSHTILMLKAMGINDLLHFDFMDPPPTNTMLTALEELYALSALDDEGLLTRLGRKMADFPMEPALAKVLIASVDLGCSDEMLSIVAMLSVQSVFYRPKEKQTAADAKKAKFHDPHGDHLTLLNVYNGWKNSKFSAPWCFENFIQARSMRRVQDVRQQLESIMLRYKHPVVSCGRTTMKVRQALCSGFFRNSARKDPQEGYRTLIEGTPVYMHPSSALFGKPAEHVIYHTLVLTTKEYMHCTTAIEPKWLVEVAPRFFKVGGGAGELSKRRKNERIQPLFNRFSDGDDWRLSAQKRQGRGGGGGTWG
ncbi:P-loop containing nucleoside triphosphate hydrolase protein [Terfezia boudieri ATCC MYA-4762]|uniref:RNA helicase n=1 Tax=Terfezia boudieri ATCC MYA-4762 TaxID=1051890 RepID=A0A3N4M2V5_9PEZI|nr:P-loop containing nucleoside triphosphate hydrolase protein [Terfezia boudieri ATCC MYA-4762]